MKKFLAPLLFLTIAAMFFALPHLVFAQVAADAAPHIAVPTGIAPWFGYVAGALNVIIAIAWGFMPSGTKTVSISIASLLTAFGASLLSGDWSAFLPIIGSTVPALAVAIRAAILHLHTAVVATKT